MYITIYSYNIDAVVPLLGDPPLERTQILANKYCEYKSASSHERTPP